MSTSKMRPIHPGEVLRDELSELELPARAVSSVRIAESELLAPRRSYGRWLDRIAGRNVDADPMVRQAAGGAG